MVPALCDRSYLSELTCFALYFHPCEVSPWPYRPAWLSHTALPAAGRASGSAVWYGPIHPDRARRSKEAQEGGQGPLQHPWGWVGDMSGYRAHSETCGRFTPAAMACCCCSWACMLLMGLMGRHAAGMGLLPLKGLC